MFTVNQLRKALAERGIDVRGSRNHKALTRKLEKLTSPEERETLIARADNGELDAPVPTAESVPVKADPETPTETPAPVEAPVAAKVARERKAKREKPAKAVKAKPARKATEKLAKGRPSREHDSHAIIRAGMEHGTPLRVMIQELLAAGIKTPRGTEAWWPSSVQSQMRTIARLDAAK